MNFKDISKRNLFLAVGALILLAGSLLIISATAASRITVCIFCADWNAKCRDAVPAIQQVVSSYAGRVDVQEFNIDLSTTPSRARSYGISVPSTIPYVVVVDRTGNTVFQQAYTRQTPDQLRSFLDSITR